MSALPTGNGAAVERLMSRVTVTDRGCWEHGGRPNHRGHVAFSLHGQATKAHRAAWILRYGDPKDLHVLHRCDNPPCVNPRHLFLGTNADNVADRHHKGRSASQRGEAHGRSKLTDQQVAELRRLAGAGTTGVDLARRFGITPSHVSQLARNLKRPTPTGDTP